MKKLIIILLFSTVALFAQAQKPLSQYTSNEGCGQNTFIYSLGGSLALTALFSGVSEKPEYWGVTAMFGLGVIYESFVSQSVNPYDLALSFAGCIIGTGVYIIIDKLIKKRYKQKIYY